MMGFTRVAASRLLAACLLLVTPASGFSQFDVPEPGYVPDYVGGGGTYVFDETAAMTIPTPEQLANLKNIKPPPNSPLFSECTFAWFECPSGFVCKPTSDTFFSMSGECVPSPEMYSSFAYDKCANGESLSEMIARSGGNLAQSTSSDLLSHTSSLLKAGELNPAVYAEGQYGAEFVGLATQLQVELSACKGSLPYSTRRALQQSSLPDMTAYFEFTVEAEAYAFQGTVSVGIYASTTGAIGFHIVPCAGVAVSAGISATVGMSAGLVLGDETVFTNTKWSFELSSLSALGMPNAQLDVGIIPDLKTISVTPFVAVSLAVGQDLSLISGKVCTAFLFPFADLTA